jgi:hypothetical protein
LLHVTSLSSRYGIGDIGPNALAWADPFVTDGHIALLGDRNLNLAAVAAWLLPCSLYPRK